MAGTLLVLERWEVPSGDKMARYGSVNAKFHKIDRFHSSEL